MERGGIFNGEEINFGCRNIESFIFSIYILTSVLQGDFIRASQKQIPTNFGSLRQTGSSEIWVVHP